MKTKLLLKDFFKVIMLLVLFCFSQIGFGQIAQALPYIMPNSAGKSFLTSDNGWIWSGIGTDYSSSGSNIKFDTTSDVATLYVSSTPDLLTYNLKGNGLTGSYIFDLLESSDGVNFIVTQNITSGIGTVNTLFQKNLLSSTRYVRWRYTSKATGNIGFGGVNITAGSSGPTITSDAASSISENSATLNGSINANSLNTDATFEYGTSTSYGSSVSATPSTVSGTTTTSISASISSLALNTQYHYRAVGTVSGTPTNGSDITFYTLAAVPGVLTISNALQTTLDVTLNATTENSNPVITEYAIQETGGQYVQANGTLGASAVWQTAATWATTTVVGLSTSTLYTFQAKARNGVNIETVFGTSASGTTLATQLVDYAVVQFPNTTQSILEGGNLTVYARAFEPGLTDLSGEQSNLFAWIGYSSTNVDPANPVFTWLPATFNAEFGNDDEYQATLSGLPIGTYYYAARFQIGTGPYVYGGSNGNWSNNSVTLNVNADVVDYANIQFPTTASITEGNTLTVYAQVYEPGITEATGQGAGIIAEIGYSSTDSTPDATWTWTSATFNVQSNNNDEYLATIGSNLTPGTYYYASRFQKTGSSIYVYGGSTGIWNTGNSGVLTVNAFENPITTAATLITPNTFTANWNAVAGATSYAIDVSTSPTFTGTPGTGNLPWINEFHYDNVGTDIGEFVEIVVPSSYSGTNLTISLYNGGNSQVYDTKLLSDLIAGNTTINQTIYYYNYPASPGFQNGSPDGLSLSDDEGLIEFISYEGSMTATNGPANGITSIDIGQLEGNTTPVGYSLQLSGSGNSAAEFTWQPEAIETKGSLNTGQTLIAPSTGTLAFVPGYENLNVGNVTSFQITGLETGTKYYYRVRAINGSLISDNSIVIDVTTTGVVKWISATNTNWSTASNWSNNLVPDGTYDIEIPSGTPILDTDFTVQSGKTFTISGTGTLTLAPSASLTVQGTANFGAKQVTLQSDATGTATIGEVNGTLSNATNVTIERYIPAKRAWRALTAPLKGSNGSLYATWQNGGSTITNTGVEMFGPSGTNLATGPNYSVLNYTPTGWVGVTNTATSNLFDTSKNNAYFVFVTGAYGNGNIASGASATTLKATGELITGDVTYSSIIDTKHTLIGNPYASPLDPSKILTGSNNMTGSFWVWDPALATTGAYVSFDDVLDTYSNYTGSYPTNTTNIQSGQAFFVKATTGNVGSFTLSENKKAAAVTNVFGKNTNQNLNDLNTASILRFGLYKESNQQWLPLDGAIAGFYDTANNLVDDKDVKKFSNGTENIAFIRDNITMSSEHFSNPQPLDEMYIRVWNTSVNNYKLRINTESFTAANIEATLVDLYTGVQTPIALDGTVQEHAFAVTSDVASTGNRFKVVFNTAALTNQTVATASVKVYPNPATNGVINVQLPEADDANYSYELVNVLGQKVLTDTIETSSINTFSIITKGLTSNWYALRILKAGNVVYQTRVIIAN